MISKGNANRIADRHLQAQHLTDHSNLFLFSSLIWGLFHGVAHCFHHAYFSLFLVDGRSRLADDCYSTLSQSLFLYWETSMIWLLLGHNEGYLSAKSAECENRTEETVTSCIFSIKADCSFPVLLRFGARLAVSIRVFRIGLNIQRWARHSFLNTGTMTMISISRERHISC